MKKRTVLFAAFICGSVLSAGIVEKTKSAPEFAGVVRFAAFQDLMSKATELGIAINNPIMPTLLMGSCQQQLVKSYGRFRNDDPIYLFYYVQVPAREMVAKDSNPGTVDEVVHTAVVYPGVNQSAKMILNHPGAKRDADGVIKLLPAEGRPNDTYVFFTKNGRYCAFADSPSIAKKAIADFDRMTEDGKLSGKKGMVEVFVNKPGFSAMMLLTKADESGVLETLGKDEKELKEISQQLADISGHEKMLRRQIVKEYDGFTAVLDFNRQGLDLSVVAVPSKDAEKCDCRGMGLPDVAFEKIPAGSPFFFAGYEGILKKTARQGADLPALLFKYIRMFSDVKHEKFFNELEQSFAGLPELGDKDWKCVWGTFNEKYEPCVDMVFSKDGKTSESRIAGKGVKTAVPENSKVTWASNYWEALPEAKKQAPSSAFLVMPYAFVKDVVFPSLGASKNSRQVKEYESLMAEMPPVEKNSALAGAGWLEKDGGYRILMRLTIGEIKNYGAAFNAFMEASLMGGVK